MGILGDVFKIGSSIIGGNSAKKASKKAQAAQIAGLNNAIGSVNSGYGDIADLLAPWEQSGVDAQDGIDDLLGLSGGDEQSTAIAQLKASPLFRSLFDTGEEAILQNGAATGGLRGGNIQGALGDFGRDTLSQVIQQQIANLMGISGNGLSAATTQGAAAGDKAAALASLFTKSGDTNAGGILQRSTINTNMINGITKSLGSIADGGGFGKIGSAIGGFF